MSSTFFEAMSGAIVDIMREGAAPAVLTTIEIVRRLDGAKFATFPLSPLDVEATLELLHNHNRIVKLYVRERHGDGDLRHVGWMLALREGVA